MKTLLAVDGSEYTRRMLSYIAAHRASFSGGTQYTVLHTVPAMPNRATAFVGADQNHCRFFVRIFAHPRPSVRAHPPRGGSFFRIVAEAQQNLDGYGKPGDRRGASSVRRQSQCFRLK